MCDTNIPASGGGSDLPGVFAVCGWFILGLLALIKGLWWLLVHVVAPLVALIAAWLFIWLTGQPILPARATRPLFTRPVRAAGRILLTLALAGAILAPTVTAIVTVTLVTAGIATVVTIRTRTKRRTGPRPAKTVNGIPVRGPRMHRDPAQPAITDHRTDLTWTEQTIRDAGRVA